ncbi:MAG: DNA polymerase III subunit delta' [Anaerolineales bacterium]|nr:DNA polymerase III subunit delta' [Anaerolineales bacterium]
MWEMVGHKWAVDLLKRALANERVAHAYLFTGPPQIGKGTLALNFAQALNCLDEEKPCGQCLACNKIAHSNHPDVQVIEGEGRTLKIDQMRTLRREAVLSPLEGRWKVYIIQRMEQATAEAANCLLKTLEEPPSGVILVLTASESEALLPTIVSRCQVLNLRPLATETVQRALQERWGVDAERARLLARLSSGRLGWAVAASQDDAIITQREKRLDEMVELLGHGRVKRLEYAQQLSHNPEAAPELLHLWLSWWRDLLLKASGSSAGVINTDRENTLREQAQRFSLGQVRNFVEALRTAVWQLEHNANTRLTLEVLMLSLPNNGL